MTEAAEDTYEKLVSQYNAYMAQSGGDGFSVGDGHAVHALMGMAAQSGTDSAIMQELRELLETKCPLCGCWVLPHGYYRHLSTHRGS